MLLGVGETLPPTPLCLRCGLLSTHERASKSMGMGGGRSVVHRFIPHLNVFLSDASAFKILGGTSRHL